MTLHAVEEADVQNGGRYLGEFRVDHVVGKERTVELAPTRSFDAEELERLGQEQGAVDHVRGHAGRQARAVGRTEQARIEGTAADKQLGGIREGRAGRGAGRSRGTGKWTASTCGGCGITRRSSRTPTCSGPCSPTATRRPSAISSTWTTSLAAAHEQEHAQEEEVAKLKVDLAAVRREVKAVAVHLAALKEKLAAIETRCRAKDRGEPGLGQGNRQNPVGRRAAHRRPDSLHRSARPGGRLTEWASTIATITAKSGPASFSARRSRRSSFSSF